MLRTLLKQQGSPRRRSEKLHSLSFPADNTCRFEDEKICGFVQDKMDNFDWTRQNALTQNPKRTVNTGPPTDISGTPEGRHTSGFLLAQVWRRDASRKASGSCGCGRRRSTDLLSAHTLLLRAGCREQAVNLHVTDWH